MGWHQWQQQGSAAGKWQQQQRMAKCNTGQQCSVVQHNVATVTSRASKGQQRAIQDSTVKQCRQACLSHCATVYSNAPCRQAYCLKNCNVAEQVKKILCNLSATQHSGSNTGLHGVAIFCVDKSGAMQCKVALASVSKGQQSGIHVANCTVTSMTFTPRSHLAFDFIGMHWTAGSPIQSFGQLGNLTKSNAALFTMVNNWHCMQPKHCALHAHCALCMAASQCCTAVQPHTGVLRHASS